jgi:hypothetical protein
MQASQQLALMTAVDDAVRLAASDRVLRLLIQNLPKLPERPAYRLFLAHYFLRRNRVSDAVRVARHCMGRCGFLKPRASRCRPSVFWR